MRGLEKISAHREDDPKESERGNGGITVKASGVTMGSVLAAEACMDVRLVVYRLEPCLRAAFRTYWRRRRTKAQGT